MSIKRVIWVLIPLAVLAVAGGLILASGRPVGSGPAAADLSVTFIGWTNNPGQTAYPTLAVVGSGTGRHVLLALTNVSRAESVQFGIADVEYSTSQGFVAGPRTFFSFPLGMAWRPSFGMRYALSLPMWLPTNQPARIRIWVDRERRGWAAVVNRWVGKELFRPWGRHEVAVILDATPASP